MNRTKWMLVLSTIVAVIAIVIAMTASQLVSHFHRMTAMRDYEQGVDALEKEDYDHAIACLSRSIQFDPANFWAYYQRAIAHFRKGDYDQAIADYTKAIQFVDYVNAYCYRGMCYSQKGQYDLAINDYTQAIRIDPQQCVCAYNERGIVYESRGDYGLAVKDYEKAIRLDPLHSYYKQGEPVRRLAWLLATCPQEEFRDGARAVELATKACQLNACEDAESLATLAAAYAEFGDFKEAAKWQKRILELGGLVQEVALDAELRLKQYEAGQPYRGRRKGK